MNKEPNPSNSFERWNIKIPTDITEGVHEALTSSKTGIMPYGAKNFLVAELLACWLRGEIEVPQLVRRKGGRDD